MFKGALKHKKTNVETGNEIQEFICSRGLSPGFEKEFSTRTLEPSNPGTHAIKNL
jgi:hypothetical protein